jgi:hypothetical protein
MHMSLNSFHTYLRNLRFVLRRRPPLVWELPLVVLVAFLATLGPLAADALARALLSYHDILF